MTAQIEDPIYYDGRKWSLIASTSDFLLNPNDYGLQTKSTSTACWRGYYGEYSITDNSHDT